MRTLAHVDDTPDNAAFFHPDEKVYSICGSLLSFVTACHTHGSTDAELSYDEQGVTKSIVDMAVYTSNRVMRMLYNIKRTETTGWLLPIQLHNTRPFGDDKAANAFNFLIGSGIGEGVHLVPSPADAGDVAVGSKRKAGGGADAKGTKKIKREYKEATDGDYEGIKACLQGLIRTMGDTNSRVHSVVKSTDFDGLYAEVRNDGERICFNQRFTKTTHMNNNSALFLYIQGNLEYTVVCVPYPILYSHFGTLRFGVF